VARIPVLAPSPDESETFRMIAVMMIWCVWFGFCEPSPPPPPTIEASARPVSSAVVADVEQWRGPVAAYFPADEVDRALCIMWHESRGDPNAYNPSTATGLMQVLQSTWGDLGDLWDPEENIRVAAYLWADGGWGHWSPWKRGECR
jgi:hypothetical protein